MLRHPNLLIRDTSKYKPFREMTGGRTPGLKKLVNSVLNISIQSGSHSSVEDARFTMSLYKHVKTDWEKSFGAKRGLEMKKFLAQRKQKTPAAPPSSKKKTVKKQSVVANDSDSGDSDSD
jgi:RNA exonuclease 4